MHDLAGRQVAGDAIQKLDCARKDKILGGSPSMANSPDSAAQSRIPMYELKWSHAEKAVARRAFDLALGKKLETLVREAKGRAARIEEPSELWDLAMQFCLFMFALSCNRPVGQRASGACLSGILVVGLI